jgi:hypothetical protein
MLPTGSGTIYAEEGKFTGTGATVIGCGRATGTYVTGFRASKCCSSSLVVES